jgi:deazaflavin-dependent oxidoreductase (nitroreductase family)
MPLPDWLGRFNRHATNRVTMPIAGWAPGFGIVVHRGRSSGRFYRTPVNVFRHGDGYAIALTYGPDRDWVRNVLAAGGADLEVRGRHVHVERPRIVADERRTPVPAPVRPALAALGVTDFLLLDAIQNGH